MFFQPIHGKNRLLTEKTVCDILNKSIKRKAGCKVLHERLKKINPDMALRVERHDNRILRRFALWTVFLLLFYFVAVYGEVSASKGVLWALVIVPVIPVGTFIANGGLKLFDPAFEGEVTKVVFSIRMEVTSAMKGKGGTTRGGMSARQVNYTKFFVKDCEGKIHKYAVQLPDNRIDLGIKVGDRVRKYHGLKYPILLQYPASICPICGSFNSEKDPYCYDCGYSIMSKI